MERMVALSNSISWTEIIITTTVSDANRYIARDTSVYYVADADRKLYMPPATAHTIVKTFAVGGDE